MRVGEQAGEYRARTLVVTIHEMAPRLDAGGPVVTLELPMPERETLARVISGTKQVSGMKQEGAPLSTHMLRRIRGGATMVTPLDVPETRYFSCLPED